MKIYYLIIISFLSVSCTLANTSWEKEKQLTQAQLDNIAILSNLYGCARYFYPNHLTASFTDADWYKFLAYGIEHTMNLQNEDLLKAELLKLFVPIIPELSFNKLSKKEIRISNDSLYYAWEHYGFGSRPVENIFKSEIKTFHKEKDTIITPDSLYGIPLSRSITAYYPIGITYKHGNTPEFRNLKKVIKKRKLQLLSINEFHYILRDILKKPFINNEIEFLKDPKIRIADLILKWNIIRHFYPYYYEDRLDQTWENALKTAIQTSNLSSNQSDYYNIVRNMFSYVHDSHLNVNLFANLTNTLGLRLPYFVSDLKLDWVNEQIYLPEVPDSLKQSLSKGDLLIGIDGIPIDSIIAQKECLVSASSKQAKFEALVNGVLLESFKYKDTLQLKFLNKTNDTIMVSVMTNKSYIIRDDNKYPYFIKEVEPRIYHINLTNHNGTDCSYQQFLRQFDSLKVAKGIILDVRGYPNYEIADSVITHFFNDSIRYGNFGRPIRYFPQQENILYKKEVNYLYSTHHTLNVPLCILINHKAMSYAETFISLFKENKIGVLIGQPTNGTNGDISMIKTPIYGFSMTTIKDLSGQHGKGILPDIYVQPTLKAIRENRDEILEAAKKYIYELDTNN